jgi:hypothetical protein
MPPRNIVENDENPVAPRRAWTIKSLHQASVGRACTVDRKGSINTLLYVPFVLDLVFTLAFRHVHRRPFITLVTIQ